MEEKTALFLEYRNLLFSLAYNMFAEVDAAEDMVQDTYLKWAETGTEHVKNVKAYLVKMVTNKCINYLNSSRARREEYTGVWLPEPIFGYGADPAQSRADAHHALSIGLLVLLQKLNPQERAIFLLREVFSYDYFELAEIFDKTEDNCRQILRRAKNNLGKDVKRFEVDMQVHEKMMRNFLKAVSGGNIEELIGILKEDIVLYADGGGTSISVNGQRLTAALNPIIGIDHVSRFLARTAPKFYQNPEFTRQVGFTNGEPSILAFRREIPCSLLVIDWGEDNKAVNIYIQANPEKLRHFRSILPE